MSLVAIINRFGGNLKNYATYSRQSASIAIRSQVNRVSNYPIYSSLSIYSS